MDVTKIYAEVAKRCDVNSKEVKKDIEDIIAFYGNRGEEPSIDSIGDYVARSALQRALLKND